MKKGNVFYGKRTIILFMIITLILLIFPKMVINIITAGGGQLGFPITFFWSGMVEPPSYHEFIFINLILDLVIYYAVAVIISFGISRLKK